MATSNATLAAFLPKDFSSTSLQQASVVRKGSKDFLRFDADNAQWAEAEGVLLRPTLTGYSGTTGIKVNIFWVSNDLKVAGAVKWVAQIASINVAESPNIRVDTEPWSATYEATTTTTVAATAGIQNVTVVNVTVANIKGLQSSTPAAGDPFRLRIRRESADAADTLLGDALVYLVELQDY